MLDYIPNDVSPDLHKFTSFAQFLSVFLNLLLGLGIAVSIIGVLLAGNQFIIAKGDAKAFDKAKRSLTYAVIAVVLAMGVYVVKRIILGLIGEDSGHMYNAVPGF